MTKRGRKKGKTTILTDTPEKNEIEKNANNRNAKKKLFNIEAMNKK